MDPAVRRHIKLEIDAAARKREGLSKRTHRVVRKPAGSKGKRWTDGEIAKVLQKCATELGVTRPTQAQYRNWRDATNANAPKVQTVQVHLRRDGMALA